MIKHFLFLGSLMVFFSASGQQTEPTDSFCIVLNEAIKAASVDWMPEYFGYWSDDVRDLPPQKTLRNLPTFAGKDSFEMVDQKLIYRSRIVSFPNNNEVAGRVWNKVKLQLSTCLSNWSMDKLANPLFPAQPDLFFTNPEDDTSVRVSAIQRGGETFFYLKIF